MSDSIVRMMQRLNGEICKPWSISKDNKDYQYCMDEGLVKFHEWPSGHYQITDKGRAYMQDIEEQAEDQQGWCDY